MRWAKRAARAAPTSSDAKAPGQERRTRGRAGWGTETGRGRKGGCRAGGRGAKLHSTREPAGALVCPRLVGWAALTPLLCEARVSFPDPPGSHHAGSAHLSGWVFIQAGGTPVSFEASPRERARSTPLLSLGLPELPDCRGTGRNLEAIAPVRLSSRNAVPSSFPLRKHNPRG